MTLILYLKHIFAKLKGHKGFQAGLHDDMGSTREGPWRILSKTWIDWDVVRLKY